MEEIRQWAFSVCAAMVACGIAQMILPKSGMSKVFAATVSVFFLCCLLSPVVLRDPGLRLEIQEYSQQDIERRAARLSDMVDNQAENAAAAQVRKIIVAKLEEMGINYRDITINMNINGQSAQAEDMGVDILLDEIHRQDGRSIRSRLETEVGMEVRLRYAQ